MVRLRSTKSLSPKARRSLKDWKTTTLYTVAQLSYVQEKYEDALRYMEIWISKAQNPSSAPRFFMATVYYQMKEYDKAINQMRLGIQIAEERGTFVKEQQWSLLTFLYFEKEDWPNVIETLKVLVESFPSESIGFVSPGSMVKKGSRKNKCIR